MRGRAASKIAYEAMVEKYAREKASGNNTEAQRVEESIKGTPHSGVFIALVDASLDDSTAILVSNSCVDAIRKYPEIHQWLR